MSTTMEELRDCLASASDYAVDDQVRLQIETAIELVDELSGPELLECPVCGRIGLPERIVDHDCRTGSTR
jgi:hypothetical protein